MKRPFLGSAALDAGLLTRRELRTGHRAIYRGVYLANEVALTARLRAEAAWLFAGPDAVLCGLSAAAVHGTQWLDVNAPAEVVRTNRHSPTGLTVHSYALAPEEVEEVGGGMRVTTVARTAFDLGRLLPENQAVPTLDALLNATGLDPERVWELAAANRGIRGVDRLRIALGQADGGSESPLQTQTRLLLRSTGIPGLRTQIPFYDEWGLVCTRAALGWPRWKVAVECDEDADIPGYREWVHSHTAELESRGWSVIWVTKSTAEGRGSPGPVVLRVQEKLWAAAQRSPSEPRSACPPIGGGRFRPVEGPISGLTWGVDSAKVISTPQGTPPKPSGDDMTDTTTTRSRFTRRIAAAAAMVVAPALAFGLSPAAHAETGTQHYQGCDDHKDDPIWDGVKPPAHGVGEHSPKHPGRNFDIQWPGHDSTRGWAVHPGVDMKTTQDLLVVPTVRETGIECDNLLRNDAPNYFKHAYESIHFMTGGPDWALGINSADARRLNQLHIHLTRLYAPARDDIAQAVKAGKVGTDEHKWVDQVVEVTGHNDKWQDSKHQYRAWITDSVDANFFKKLEDDIVTPLNKQGKSAAMAHETLLVTRNPAGKGFVVLESNTTSGIHGVANIEGILDKR